LPAKAFVQSKNFTADPPLSLASQLLQLNCAMPSTGFAEVAVAVAVAVGVAVAVAVALALALASDLPPLSQRPNAGVAQGAPRQGCRGSRPRPWMADGGGPPEQCRSEGMPSLGEAPNGGAKALGYLGLFQVTRCKSETASGRYRSNGYVPRQKPPAAVTAATDMYPDKTRQRPLPQKRICTPTKTASSHAQTNEYAHHQKTIPLT